MLKNKNYVYGDEMMVPSHLHYGKYILDKICKFKDNVAIIDAVTNETITYNEMSQLTVDIALSLVHMGVKKGDIIGICAEERIEYPSTILGILYAGATFLQVETTGKTSILHRLQETKPRTLFCSKICYTTHKDTLQSVGCVEKYIIYEDEGIEGTVRFKDFLTKHGTVEDLVPVPLNGWEDIAFIMYSSGTTGVPKGVPLTHLNCITIAENEVDPRNYIGKRIMPMFEFHILNNAFLCAGATVVYVKSSESEYLLQVISKYKVQILNQSPTNLFDLVHNPNLRKYDLSSLESILTTSAPVTLQLIAAIKEKIPQIGNFYQSYGATEFGAAIGDEQTLKGPKLGSMGCAFRSFTIKVVDLSTGEAVGPNKRGEIRVSSPAVFPGYIGSSFRDCFDEEGFYKTGDIGYYDEDKYFYFVNRIADTINFCGHLVSASELESVLLQHPAVHEAAVVAKPDVRCIELPTAFVVLKPGAEATAEEIVNFVNSQVIQWMALDGGVRIIAALPRGGRQKIDRKALRRMLELNRDEA